MTLEFSVAGVRALKFAAVPTLVFRLRIDEKEGLAVHAMLLRCQLQIEPRRRPHSAPEKDRLLEMFGEPARWSETMRPVIWTQANLTVPAFEHSVEVDLPVTCTYDFEVTAAKYLQGLEGGDVPLLFLFSGTVFIATETGYSVQQVPWEKEAAYRMAVSVWRELMEAYFPGSAWLRLSRDSLDALARFKAERALFTWDDAVAALIDSYRAATARERSPQETAP